VIKSLLLSHTFPGWTLPGVIGAGAAQTMMNLHGTLPGKRVLMLGSGNVGLVVSFQLMQAGCEVVAVADAAPRVGGYGVHAAKVARCGVPFYLSHTIISADGEDCVTGVTIGEVDKNWQIIPGTEKHFDVDTICLKDTDDNGIQDNLYAQFCGFCQKFFPDVESANLCLVFLGAEKLMDLFEQLSAGALVFIEHDNIHAVFLCFDRCTQTRRLSKAITKGSRSRLLSEE